MKKKGFTLIEIIMVVVILAVVSFIFGAFITTAIDSWVFVKTREDALSSARKSIIRMTREMRRIKKPVHIITATTTECQFVDIGEGIVDFKQNGTNLLRNDVVLATGVVDPGGLVFTYLDEDGNPTSVKQDIRSIRIKLNIQREEQDIKLESAVRIRNL